MAECKYRCGQPITWCINDNTNKPAPLDAMPDPAGNCVILNVVDSTGDPIYHVLTKKDRAERTHEGRQRHTNHWQTCPNAPRRGK